MVAYRFVQWLPELRMCPGFHTVLEQAVNASCIYIRTVLSIDASRFPRRLDGTLEEDQRLRSICASEIANEQPDCRA
jgi:hypothetical protein